MQWQSLRCFAGIDSQLGDFDQVTTRRDMATPTGTDFRPGAVAGSPGYFTLNPIRPMGRINWAKTGLLFHGQYAGTKTDDLHTTRARALLQQPFQESLQLVAAELGIP